MEVFLFLLSHLLGQPCACIPASDRCIFKHELGGKISDYALAKYLAPCHRATTILKDECGIFVLCARYIFFHSFPWRRKYPG